MSVLCVYYIVHMQSDFDLDKDKKVIGIISIYDYSFQFFLIEIRVDITTLTYVIQRSIITTHFMAVKLGFTILIAVEFVCTISIML